jgi:hypothetical protein
MPRMLLNARMQGCFGASVALLSVMVLAGILFSFFLPISSSLPPMGTASTPTPAQPSNDLQVAPQIITQSCQIFPVAQAASAVPLVQFTVTLHNASQNRSIAWSIAFAEMVSANNPTIWASADTPSGMLAPGTSQKVTITSDPTLCQSLSQNTTFHVTVHEQSNQRADVNRQDVAATISPPPWPALSHLPRLQGAIGGRYLKSQDRLIFTEYDGGAISAVNNLSTTPTYQVLGEATPIQKISSSPLTIKQPTSPSRTPIS